MSDEVSIDEIAEESARGGYYLFVGNALTTVLLFVSSIVIGRLFGPEVYGLYSLVLVVPSLLIGLVDLGIGSAVTRFLAESKLSGKLADVNFVAKIGLLVELIVGAAASIFCFVFSTELATLVINTPEASGYIQIVAILILLQALFNTLSSIFIGLDKMENNAIMMVIRAVIKLVFSTVLILLGFSVFGAILGHLLCYFVAVIAGMAFLVFNLRKNRSNQKASPNLLKSMFKYGAPLYISSIVVLLMTQYETIIMAYFVSKAVIGNYQVTTLFRTAIFIIVYPLAALFPAFSKINPKSEQLNQFFRRSVKYTAFLLIPASVAIAVLSNDLILAFYGSAYDLAPLYLSLYTLTYLYSGLGSAVFGFLFNGIKRTDVTLKSKIITLAIFLPLAPILTSLYGVVGLIATIFISNFISLVYSLVIAYRKINVSIDMRSSLKIYLATGLSALVLYLFTVVSPFTGVVNLICGGALFIFTYLTLLPIIGVINLTDIDIFRTQFNKIKSIWPVLKILLSYETKILNYKNKTNQ